MHQSFATPATLVPCKFRGFRDLNTLILSSHCPGSAAWLCGAFDFEPDCSQGNSGVVFTGQYFYHVSAGIQCSYFSNCYQTEYSVKVQWLFGGSLPENPPPQCSA